MKKVLLFGSSLNPLTQAHLAIIHALSNSYPDAEIRIVPTYKHPDPKVLASYEHRFSMTEQVIQGKKRQGQLLNVTVSRVEETIYHTQKEVVRTYQLLNYLKEREKSTHFSFVFGGDTMAALLAGKWAKGEDIIKACASLIYIHRPGSDLQEIKSTYVNKAIQIAIDKNPAKFKCLEVFDSNTHHLKNISSTGFRELRGIDDDLLNVVPREVLFHVYQHRLYAFSPHFYTINTVRDWYKAKNKCDTLTEHDEQQIAEEVERRKTAQAKAITYIKRHLRQDSKISSISMMILGGFIAATGITAVALVCTVFPPIFLFNSSLVIASIGGAAALLGLGLFAMGFYNNKIHTEYSIEGEDKHAEKQNRA